MFDGILYPIWYSHSVKMKCYNHWQWCFDLLLQLQIIGVMKNVSKGILHFEVVVDHWPNFKAVVCRPDMAKHMVRHTIRFITYTVETSLSLYLVIIKCYLQMPTGFRSIWYFYAENPSSLENLIRHPGVINTQEQFYVKGIVFVLFSFFGTACWMCPQWHV